MQFEVEKKFWIADFDELVRKLEALNATFFEPVDHIDQYFKHPARDFSETDEALRLRRIEGKNFVTYKGARIDATTKTRQELELGLRDGDEVCEDFAKLLSVLGFEPIMTVRKTRRKAICPWENDEVEVCLDEIDQLGRFVELETTCDAQQLESAKELLSSLTDHLELTRDERRSYLELLRHQLSPQQVTGQPRDRR